MGYYSEVAIAMLKKDFDRLTIKAREEQNKDVIDLLEWADITMEKASDDEDDGESGVVLHWNGIKWYDSYDNVKFMKNFLHDGIDYYFKRIGEEEGDIETDYEDDENDPHCLYEYIETVTSMEININGDEVDFSKYVPKGTPVETSMDFAQVVGDQTTV